MQKERRKTPYAVPPDGMTSGVKRVERIILSQLHFLSQDIRSRDPNVWQTGQDLAQHSIMLSQEMMKVSAARGRDPYMTQVGRLIGLGHDVGKLDERFDFCFRRELFTPEQHEIMKEHSKAGGDFLIARLHVARKEDHPFLWLVIVGSSCTHEPHLVFSAIQVEQHASQLFLVCVDCMVLDCFLASQEARERPGLPTHLAVERLPDIVWSRCAKKYPQLMEYPGAINESVGIVQRLYGIESLGDHELISKIEHNLEKGRRPAQ